MDLRSVQSINVRGLFYRHIPAGGDPLFRPELPADGRWQRGEIIEGFYLARSEQTAWSEWYRALAELAVPPMRQMPRDLWGFDVHVEGVADLLDEGALEALGLPLLAPLRRQWPQFQAVGEALAKEGWPGILFPSASRTFQSEKSDESEGDQALCLFRSAAASQASHPSQGGSGIPGVSPYGSPSRYDEPPAPPTSLRT